MTTEHDRVPLEIEVPYALYDVQDRFRAAVESPYREQLLQLAADLRARHEPPGGR